MHHRRRRGDAEGQADLGDLSAQRHAAEAGRARGAGGICRDAELHRRARRQRALSRAARRHPGRLHEEERRLHRPARISRPTRRSSASRSAPTIAAGKSSGRRRPRHPACTSREMLNILEGYDIAGLGFGSAETIHYLAEVLKIAFADRAAASGDPDYHQRPGGAADLEGLCRGAPPRDRSRPRAGLERRRRAARKRGHHAHDGGGCVRQRGRDHPDHQQSVRRQDPDPGPRHRAEQLHEPVRSPSRPRAVAGARASASPPRCRR